MTAPIATPCIQVCVMDEAAGLCTGCGRTLEEIARWGAMSTEERSRVMAALPDRMARRLRTGTQAEDKPAGLGGDASRCIAG